MITDDNYDLDLFKEWLDEETHLHRNIEIEFVTSSCGRKGHTSSSNEYHKVLEIHYKYDIERWEGQYNITYLPIHEYDRLIRDKKLKELLK